MSDKVQKALEERKKRKEEASKNSSTDKVSAALEARKNRMKGNATSAASDILNRYNSAIDSYKSYITDNSSLASGTYSEGIDLKSVLDDQRERSLAISKLIRDIEAYRGYIGEDAADKALADLKGISGDYSGILKNAEYLSQYKTEDEYQQAVKEQDKIKNWADPEYLKTLSLSKDTYSSIYDNYENYFVPKAGTMDKEKTQKSGVITYYNKADEEAATKERDAWLANVTKQALGVPMTAEELAEKYNLTRLEYAQAQRYSNGLKLTNDALNAEDFAEKSQYVSTKADGILDKLTSDALGYNDSTYEYINNVDGYRDNYKDANRVYSRNNPYGDDESSLESKGYAHLTPDEVAVYNYYYATKGKEKAEEYLDTIQEILNMRKAGADFKEIEGRTFKELGFGVEAGLDQFKSGMASLVNTKDDYIPPSSTQMMSGMVREDLADNGPQILGSSLGQIGYDLTTTTSNMIPSILTSAAISYINPVAGQVVGAGLMGASAAGNAYAETINLGYDKGEARLYSGMVGASEATLQYLLGGIGKLGGGKLTTEAVVGIANNMDNAFARVALKLGANAAGEFTEEYLQEVLNPFFKNLTLGTSEDIKLFSTEALYSGILGALSAGVLEGGSTISSDIQTTKLGKKVQNIDGGVERLKKLGTTFSADAVAHQIADKVTEETGAYKIGLLLQEAGSSLSEQNISDIVAELTKKGMAESNAKKLAKTYQAFIDNEMTLTDEQIKVLEGCDPLSDVLRKSIIGRNTSVYQRSREYNELFNLATDMVTDTEASPAPQTDAEETSQNFAPYSQEYLSSAAKEFEAMGMSAEHAKIMAQAKLSSPSKSNSTPTVEKAAESKFEVSEDNETINTKTGEAVKVVGIESIKGGEMVLRVENSEGKTESVKATDVSFSADDALIYSAVADMGASETAAWNIVKNFKPADGVSANVYAQDVAFAYKYGVLNYKKGLSNLDLTADQALVAFYQGRNDSDAKLKPKKSTTPATTSKGKGKVIFEGFKYNEKKANPNQKASMAAINFIAEMSPLEIHVYESFRENGKLMAYVNGKKRLAPNGYFIEGTNKIYIDINAGSNSEGLMLDTAGHEISHYIAEWNWEGFKELGDFLFEHYGADVKVEKLIERQEARVIESYKRDGKAIPSEDVLFRKAYEETVADAMSKMLADERAYVKLAELKQQNRTLWEKLGEAIKNLLNKIKSLIGAYSNEDFVSQDAEYVAEFSKDVYEKLQDLYIKAFMGANEAVESSDIASIDTDSKSVSPVMSERTWTESEYVTEREKTAKAIASALGVDIKTAYKYIDDINSVARLIADDRVRLDYDPNIDENATVLKKNSDYKYSVDMSTLCAKRLLTTGTFDAIQRRLPNTVFTSEDIVALREMMLKKGYEVACGICYVESTRREMGRITQDFINSYIESQKTGKPITRTNSSGQAVDLKKTKDEMLTTADKSADKFYADKGYTPTLADLNTTDIDLVKRDHPLVYEAYLNFMNARGQAKPKLLETRAEYKGEILKHFKAKSAVNSRNKAGGLRLQSFSDFEVPHLIDMMQIIMDMSRVGLMSQAYTKVPAFAEVFGNTGVKINLSLIAKGSGLDANGNLIFDDVEGINHEEAFRLRDKFSKNVGTILVGKTDAHIIAAMADPRIDYIIPFHKSSWKESLYEALGLTGYADYTDTQNEKPIDKNRTIKNFEPSEYWDFTKSGDENAQIYLEMCRKDGRIPKFPQFQGYPGYWKLLIDFKMYDNDGAGSPQEVVRPTFEMDAANKVLEEYKGGHKTFPVAKDVVEDFVSDYVHNAKFSDRDLAPTFYSQMGKTVAEMKQAKIGADSVIPYLTGRGVKAEEIKWSGIEEFLEGKKSVTKEELQEFVAGSQLQIEEETLTGKPVTVNKKFGNKYELVIDGEVVDVFRYNKGSGWYDSIKTDRGFRTLERAKEFYSLDRGDAKWGDRDYKLNQGENYREVLFRMPNSEYTNKAMGVHWGEDRKGILAHARIQDFEVDGKKMLFIEEIQSDWHNAGHKEGYEGETEGGVVPDAPFKENYHEFVLKSLLRMAAEQGYDTIGWTTADIQSERWSDDYAESYRIEYDQNIPKFLRKYGKKWGASVGSSVLNNGAEVWSMDITDAMKDSVLHEGQVMYSDREYMDAVNDGDTETAQILVDEAAKKAGYSVKAYHGTGADFNIFSEEKIGGRNVWGRGFYFGTSKGIADDYASLGVRKGGKYRIVNAALKMDNPFIPHKSSLGTAEEILDTWFSDMWKNSRDLGIGYLQGKLDNSPLDLLQFIAEHNNIEIKDVLQKYGFDSVKDGGELVVFSANQIKSADPITYDDSGKVIPLSERFKADNPDIRYSDRDFSYDELVAKEDLKGVVIDKTLHPKIASGIIDNNWVVNKVREKCESVTRKGGIAYYTNVPDIGENVEIIGDGITHGFARANDRRNGKSTPKAVVNARVALAIPQILNNSIEVNRSNRGSNINVPYTHVLIGTVALENDDGTLDYYAVRSMVQERKNQNPILVEANILGMLTSTNAKKIDSPNAWVTTKNGVARTYGRAYTYKIADLLNDVKDIFGNTFSEDVYQHLGTTRIVDDFSENLLFSERDPSTSNRSILADALESAAANEIERKRLAEYKEKIALIEEEEERRAEIQKLLFGKEPLEPAERKALQFEARQITNRINTYDRQLLRLEATTPIRSLLEREKEMARKRQKQKDAEAMREYKAKVAKTQRELLERNQESRKKAMDSRHRTEMRNKIKKVVSELNTLLLNGTKERNVKLGLQDSVAKALEAINMDTVGADERVAKYDELIAKATDPDVIASLVETRDRIQAQGDSLADKLEAMKKAYADIRRNSKEYAQYYQQEAELIEYAIADVIEKVGNTSIRNMSLDQLTAVYDMFRVVLQTVRYANELHTEGKVEELRKNASSVMTELEGVKTLEEERVALGEKIREFSWNEMIPVYAFRRTGSKTLERFYWEMIRGQNTYAEDLAEAEAFKSAIREKYGHGKWNLNKVHEFKLADGRTFRLTLEHMMSIYAYSKREQAFEHMTTGGFFFNDKATFRRKGGVLKLIKSNEAGYTVDFELLKAIVAKMEDEAKGSTKYVDEMQEYLTNMGEKGNEVSRVVWGIDIFKEKVYFPLKSSKDFIYQANQTAQESSLKHDGMTKETKPGASNPIILEAFDDVWASHVNRMSQYHGYVIPIDNMNKLLNYGSWAGTDSISVTTMLRARFGEAVNEYFNQFIKDMNGASSTSGASNPFFSLVSKFKKTAVAASTSVVVQQPTAILRATAVMDGKYFVGLPEARKLSTKWEEVKKYAPIAVIKEIGGFEAGAGRQATEWLNSDARRGIDKISSKIDDITMMGAAFGDEIGWCTIWEAVKREIEDTTNLKVGTDEFLKAVGERFTEVIVMTQVYDSTLSRSGYMRSKHDSVKMLTSFMGEPTVSANMMFDAIIQAKRKTITKRNATRIIGATYASILAASVAASLIYALRDDDEDESYLEKFAEAFGGKLLGDINPLNMLPGVRDIVSIFDGWDVERTDMAVVKDIKDAFDGLFSENKSPWRKVEDFAGAIASAFGVPLKNTLRTGREIYNFFKNIFDDITPSGVGEAFGRGITGEKKDKSKALYDAIVNGDKARLDIYHKGYKDDKAYETAVRKALRDNDPRIKEAAEARIDGDIAEYTRIVKEIKAEGFFSQDTIVASVNAEINAINKGEETESSSDAAKAKSIYKMDDYYASIVGSDQASAYVVKEDIISTAIANGKEREDAEDSFNSQFASYLREEFEKGNISTSEAERMLVNYGDKSDEAAASKVQYWAFKQEYPDYDDLSEEAVDKYYNEVEPYGITVDVYYDYSKQRSKCKGTDNDGDGKTDSGSKKTEILWVIHSLPISSSQKDALYYLNGWSAKTIYEAPWH